MTTSAPTEYDTYVHFAMSGALSYSWYTNIADNKENVSILDEAGHTGWSIALVERGDDEATCRKYNIPVRPGTAYILDHATLLAAIQRIADTVGLVCRDALRECRNFLTDRETADFDADTADQVIQVALFGQIFYS